MELPFSADQFLSVFEDYNRTVWPFQIVLNLLALASIVLAVRKTRYSNAIISGILAFLWLWTGLAYHLTFFTAINPAAYAFAVLAVVQGILFFAAGAIGSRLRFGYRTTVYGVTGAIFAVYGLIIYPLLGSLLGHSYPGAPTFGLPCPTTIFTFGLLLWTEARVPKFVLIIPVLWSLTGFLAALSLGIGEDVGLLVAGVTGTVLIMLRDHWLMRDFPRVGRAA